MEINDLLALVHAGYTKEEIAAFTANGTSSLPIEPSGPVSEPADPAPVREEQPAAPAAAAAPAVDNSEVLSALKELTKTIQRNAILRDSLPAVKQDAAEDILGRIINPTGK